MGYHRAGFDVVGVDIKPQPHFPFEFVQADAFDYLIGLADDNAGFSAIHASPPCQAFSAMRKGRWKERKHPNLIHVIREMLCVLELPYIIENVPGAPLRNPTILCGTMFGLATDAGNQLFRHRLFETSFPMGLVPPCNHKNLSAVGVYGGGQHPLRRRRPRKRDRANQQEANFGIRARRQAMGIDWMTGQELNQAIPPAYTEFIGKQLMAIIKAMNDRRLP